MNILFNTDHDVRSGWKFAMYVLVYVGVLIVTALALSVVFAITRAPESDIVRLAQNVIVLAVPGILTMLFMVRFVEHLPLEVFGVTFHERWQRDVLLGLGLSAGMLGVMLAGSAAFGHLEMRWTAREAPVGSMFLTLGLLIMAAANEELVFRGYPMQVMMRGIGPRPAVLVMSGLFGLLHMNNPNATVLGTMNTMLAGLMLSIAYLKTRSLWLPFGIHVGWNVGLGMVFGFPLSGIDIGSLWTSQTTGADFVVGGSYGPEGGLLATLVFGAAALTIRAIRTIQISPKLRAALATRKEDWGQSPVLPHV